MSGKRDRRRPDSAPSQESPLQHDGVGVRRADAAPVVAVALTGGIGSGKSTALAMFSDEGALTLSADQIVHDLYREPAVVARIAERFGDGVVGQDGSVDRRSLSEAVGENPEHLRWLEEVTHPLVAAEIERSIADAPPGSVLVCEVPLLFEAGLEEFFDLIVTVEASPEERMRRSAHRTSMEAFLEFDRLQASAARRAVGSDLVFHNEGDLGALRTFVRSAYTRAVTLLDGDRE